VDWVEWHAGYDDDGSRLAHRLRIVQGLVRTALDALPAGPATAISMCAGQGRDLIEVPWFERHGFERLFLTAPELGFGVGAHRLTREPSPVPAGMRMFTFIGSDVLRAQAEP